MTDSSMRLNTALQGRYHIERQLGEGGMATVYLAQDLKHDRQVALKVLKPELAAVVGAERFLNEIKTTANLQHPHILALHDSGEADGLVFYVMPYVEGESLRDRLEREKELPVQDAIEISRAVAGALDYAHRHDVVHRDIKPENILLHDGQPVVADFGIALAVSAGGGDRLTETGMSVGTPHYMSPEQATGDRTVDARSDLYSLACVTYEMLTGEPPYTGPSAQAIMAKVITQEPASLTTSRSSVPPHMDAAVRKALAKLPADRFETAAEFANALTDSGATGTISRTGIVGSTEHRRPTGLIAALVAAIALAGWGWLRPGTTSSDSEVLTAIVGSAWLDHGGAGIGVGISPDGRTVVFSALNDGISMLFRRRLDELTATPIPTTEGGHDPVFSPDGQWLAFKAGDGLKKVRVDGGSALTLLESGVAPNGGLSWGPDDFLYFPRCCPDIAISRVSARGGTPEIVTEVTYPEEHWAPSFLPSGNRALFTSWSEAGEQQLSLLSVDDGTWTEVAEGGFFNPQAVADDHVVFAREDGALYSAELDIAIPAIIGDPLPVTDIDTPGGNYAATQFSLSASGAFVYIPATRQRLLLRERDGEESVISSDTRYFADPVFSPDGGMVGVTSGLDTVWAYDLDSGRGTVVRTNQVRTPGWTSDSRRTVSLAETHDTLFITPVDQGTSGEAVPLESPRDLVVWSGAPGPIILRLLGDTAFYTLVKGPEGWEEAEIPVQGFNHGRASLSPDGHWLAYRSFGSESLRFPEIWIQEFPGPGRSVRVGIGANPQWSPDGSQLLFLRSVEDGSASVMSVSFDSDLTIGDEVTHWPRALEVAVGWRAPIRNFGLSADGERAVVVERTPKDVVLVQNWVEWFERRSGRN